MRTHAPKLLLFPFDLGGDRSGTRSGPGAFLSYVRRDPDISTLAASAVNALFDGTSSDRARRKRLSTMRPPTTIPHYVEETMEACMLLGAAVEDTLAYSAIPLVIGGDHCAPMGSIASAYGVYGSSLGVIWIDAHLDAHGANSGSPSGNTNGMPIAALLGEGDHRLLDTVRSSTRPRTFMMPSQWFHAGADSYEPGEERFIRASRAQGFILWTYEELRYRYCDFFASLRSFIAQTDRVWVSLDLDAVLAYWAPAVAYDRDGKLSMQFVLEMASVIGASGKVVGADIVELNPRREKRYEFGHLRGKPKTSLLAAEFAKRLLAIPSTVLPYSVPSPTKSPFTAFDTTPPA